MRKLKGSYDLPCPLFGIRWLGLTVFQAYSFVHYKGRSGDAKFTKWVGFCLHVAILAWILAVAVSVCHNSVSVERDGQIELVLAWRLSLTYLTLPYLEFQVSTQLRVLTDLENFSMAYRSSQHFFNLATQTWTLLV